MYNLSKEALALHENHIKFICPFRPLLYILFAFLAGCLLSGLFFHWQRPYTVRELDRRYDLEYRSAAETIGRLEAELGREREINRGLREHNSRARELAEGLSDTAGRNVQNLQGAIGLVSEIRKKLKVLEDLYADSGSNSGAP